MKKINILLFLLSLFAVHNALAQQNSNLTLSDLYPAAGETIHLVYDPAGTFLAGKDSVSARAFFLGKNNTSFDLTLVRDGNLWKSDFIIPDSTVFFFIYTNKGADIENNRGNGYTFYVYKDKVPVPGAYAVQAGIMSYSIRPLGNMIALTVSQRLALYRKELDLHPEGLKIYGDDYYSTLAASADPNDIAAVNKRLAELEQSGTEKDLMSASGLLRSEKKKSAVDSLNIVIAGKFPKGTAARQKVANAFLSNADLEKRDSLYKVLSTDFPPVPPAKEGLDLQQYFAAQLAEAYAKKGDWAATDKYLAAIKDKTLIPGAYNDIAYEMAKKGEHMDEAAKLSKESLDILQANIDTPKATLYQTANDIKASAGYSYDTFADTYALILLKQGNAPEALKYQQQVYDHSTKPLDPEEMEHYLLILNTLGKYGQAKAAAEENIKNDKSSDVIEHEFKKAYVKVNGSDKGYADYLAKLKTIAKEKSMAELAKTMINKPAPQFALKDLDGKTVSLADLKGKVVIVDFWATWCGPCKASFPGMQMAVNKYKDNPNVKFLFVDCWENGDNFNVDGVKKFIADNKYSFHVLLDEKADDGRQSKVNSQFGVTGIPTKFIIDKNGNIRFNVVGFDGSSEQILNEVTEMIDMTQNPDSIPGIKVSMNK